MIATYIRPRENDRNVRWPRQELLITYNYIKLKKTQRFNLLIYLFCSERKQSRQELLISRNYIKAKKNTTI